MFEMFAKLFNTIYGRFVSCFRLKHSVLTESESECESENEYGILPDYEPMNEMSNLNKIKIQIPKYQFILLEDD